MFINTYILQKQLLCKVVALQSSCFAKAVANKIIKEGYDII